jgi:hypothetical protein
MKCDAELTLLVLTLLVENQPLNNECFYQHIQQMTDQRRENNPRGRPRKTPEGSGITGELEH